MKQGKKLIKEQTVVDKALTLGAGAGGISLAFVDVVNIFQAVGIIVGAVMVCAQCYVFFKKNFFQK